MLVCTQIPRIIYIHKGFSSGCGRREIPGETQVEKGHAGNTGSHPESADCSVSYSTDSTAPYSTVQYSTVQYSTVQYSTVQYSTVQHRTA